jgi:hypothetical protein
MRSAMVKLLLISFMLTTVAVNSFAVADASMKPLNISIAQVSRSGAIDVELINVSESPVRVFKESNSWGADRWRVLVIRRGNLTVYSQRLNQVFTRNIPASEELAPGARLRKALDLNTKAWRKADDPKVTFDSGDIIIAIYDVPFTPEAHKFGVWNGTIAGLKTVE